MTNYEMLYNFLKEKYCGFKTLGCSDLIVWEKRFESDNPATYMTNEERVIYKRLERLVMEEKTKK